MNKKTKAILIATALLICLTGCRKKREGMEPVKPAVGALRYHQGQIQYYIDNGYFSHWECANVAQQNQIDYLQEQIDCLASGGHNLGFAEKQDEARYTYEHYVFKCSKCGKKLSKLETELTPDERTALEILGIVKPQGQKSKMQ